MNLVVSWYKRDVKKQRFQVRYWVVSNIFISLYISGEKFVEKFSKCCENGIACLRKGKLRRCSSSLLERCRCGKKTHPGNELDQCTRRRHTLTRFNTPSQIL